MIRVGLVGAGPWAGMFHAPMLTSAPDLELSAVWARRHEAAVGLAQRSGAVAAQSFDDLLERCVAVAFCVPPDVQAALAPRAAAAGKHLLLEKPLAFSVADAEAIAAAADGVVTQVLLAYRYTAQVREFVRAVDGTAVRHVRTAWIGGGALTGSPFATPWRQAAGASLLDLGPHTLDLAVAVAGPVTELLAAESGGVVTVTTAHAGGATGHVALSGSTPGARGPLEGEAVTDAGRFVLADPTPDPPGDVQCTIAAEFGRAVHGETAQSLDVHHGVRLQRLLSAVAQSVRTRRSVIP